MSTVKRSPAEMSGRAPTYTPDSEIQNRLTDALTESGCQSCGTPGEVYTVASPASVGHIEATSFTFCPSCAVALVDEVAYGLPDDYLDVLVAAVQRRVARRAERPGVER